MNYFYNEEQTEILNLARTITDNEVRPMAAELDRTEEYPREIIQQFGEAGLLGVYIDEEHGGFYWMLDRAGNVINDQKIIYGHSFAIYSLSEYTLATGDQRGIEYAEKVFDMIQKYCVDSMYGG